MLCAFYRLFVAVALAAHFYCLPAQVITTFAGTDFSFPKTPIAAINALTATWKGRYSSHGCSRTLKMLSAARLSGRNRGDS